MMGWMREVGSLIGLVARMGCPLIDARKGTTAMTTEQPDLTEIAAPKTRFRLQGDYECFGCGALLPGYFNTTTGRIEIDTDVCPCQKAEYLEGYNQALLDFDIDPDRELAPKLNQGVHNISGASSAIDGF